MKKVVARNGAELAKAIGFSPGYAVEWDVRAVLNDKIIEIVEREQITHAALAKLAETSRPRITALLNRRRDDISTDLMLRILASLGYIPRLSFKKLA